MDILTIIFLILFAHSSIIFGPTTVESCNAIDKEALLQFKRGIEYDGGGHLSTWIPNTDCCTKWNKVECDPATGRVISISPFQITDPLESDISYLINGTISPFLGNLTYLQYLNLYHFNQHYLDRPSGLRGLIPPELGRLSHLTYLGLSFNTFTGPIPTSFVNLRRLKGIDLSYNSFSGDEILKSIVKLKQLTGIDLSHNQIGGVIPDSLSELSQLQILHLENNKFTGRIPDSLGKLSSLTYINLSNNKFTGTIPAKVLNLKLLQNFDVSNNQLSGRIPQHNSTIIPDSAFSGNPGLCDAPLPPCKR
ncbi:hypothetical protein SOVF_050560 [Spinacia oleracea]|uniref:Receptor-like protein 33 n=1 Tax=Spinacia oleracea TaxID=3562 RepID=A0ABM3R868_SPIOL|nr:receptor-like protein 33 [Spinacia oleracea]KNA20617.1 hypothetical protein SOVF_050560 [Spinacia oleracea]